jgi:3-oxoacyl-[acyl-carrier-protein] synthase-3
MFKKSIITGHGSYLPSKVLTNFDLEKTVETNDSWIVERTGIKQRHIAEANELTSDMAIKAAENAINTAKIDKQQIDLIIVATTTPDLTFPSTAVKVQAQLGIKNCIAFDIQAVCAGFIYGLNIADNFIKTNQARNILLIGAEKMSSIIDWQDRATCVLFGDGAGAVIISAQENTEKGIISCKSYSDGNLYDILYTSGGVASTGDAGKIKMIGKEVFRHGVEKMSSSIIDILNDNQLTANDIDVFIPHQANIRIIEGVARKLNFPMEKVICTVDMQANTSAATIPLALDYALNNNLIKSNDLVAMTALGAGLCWGSSLIRW